MGLRADWVIHGAELCSRNLNDTGPLEMIDIIVQATAAVLVVARSCPWTPASPWAIFSGMVWMGTTSASWGTAPPCAYLHTDDLSHCLGTILAEDALGRPYNVEARHPVSIRQLTEYVTRLCRVPVTVAQQSRPNAQPARYVPCITRSREELALSPILDWQEAVARTLTWHQAYRQEVRS